VTDAVSPVAQVAFLAAATAALARHADLDAGLRDLLARASEAAGATRAWPPKDAVTRSESAAAATSDRPDPWNR
jgi:hypothetical protein